MNLKKNKYWILYCIFITFLIVIILYGSLLRHHYLGGQQFNNISKIATFFADIPSNLKKILLPDYDIISKKHKDKKKLSSKINKNEDRLLLLSRYSPTKKNFVVEIIDLKTFEVLHQYKNTKKKEIIKFINNKEEYKNFISRPKNKQIMKSPLMLRDGSIIYQQEYGPLVRKNFCGKIMWVNSEDLFHHYITKYDDKHIFVPSSKYPFSNKVGNYKKNFGFKDDSITKLNIDGTIIYQKSLIEILKENDFLSDSIFKNEDPIHLNKIEPVLKDTKYFKKGDLFLSSPTISTIIHYSPISNKIINYLVGEFSWQHDVDVISENEISIFNNNEYGIDSKYSEILIYNFETKKYKKILEKKLKKENFKTRLQGVHQTLNDGSLLLEETMHGRLLLFDKYGNLKLEYINKHNNKSYMLAWSTIIEDKDLIEKILNLIKIKKCI